MTTDTLLNHSRLIFKGGAVRSPSTSERSGSFQFSVKPAKQAEDRTRVYTIIVRDGRLQVDNLPRKLAK